VDIQQAVGPYIVNRKR